jgi:predicted acetyltransferase
LEISDAFCPWNRGRYALDVSSEDVGLAEPTTEPADLACTVNEIAAAYLGGTSFRQLNRAGRVHEAAAGALVRADAMFACDPAPWFPYEF